MPKKKDVAIKQEPQTVVQKRKPRSENYKKLVKKVNRESKKFIKTERTFDPSLDKVSFMGNKFENYKKKLLANKQKWKPIMKIFSDNINQTQKQKGSHDLVSAMSMILKIAEETFSVLSEYEDFLNLCHNIAYKEREKGESLIQEHKAVIQEFFMLLEKDVIE